MVRLDVARHQRGLGEDPLQIAGQLTPLAPGDSESEGGDVAGDLSWE